MTATNVTEPGSEREAPIGRLALGLLAECCGLAIAFGTAFLLLLVSHRGGQGPLVAGAIDALALLGLWLGMRRFRPRTSFVASQAAIYLVPVALIVFGWFGLSRSGPALMVECLCIALPIAGIV